MKKVRTYHAWAIDLKFGGHTLWPLAGRGWFSWPAVPPCASGLPLALFRTRAEARAAWKAFSGSTTKAVIVRVSVTVRPAAARLELLNDPNAEKCEGCSNVATTTDSVGVPLCDVCYDGLDPS